MNDFVNRARKAAPSRHRVRDAVGECLTDIQAARSEGLSWATIFGQLKRDGKQVGKGPSSLRNAVLALTATDKPIATPLVGTALPAPAVAQPSPVKPTSSFGDLGDTRFKRDWS